MIVVLVVVVVVVSAVIYLFNTTQHINQTMTISTHIISSNSTEPRLCLESILFLIHSVDVISFAARYSIFAHFYAGDRSCISA